MYQRGLIGALLRREGLYTSHLAAWRRHRETGVLQAMALKKRGHEAGQSARFTYRAQALADTVFLKMVG